jgi:alpha-L-rhamnosidase
MHWNGKWIWDSGDEKPVNYYLFIRKTFDLAEIPTGAMANICADSRYKLWVNGRFVARGPVRSDPRWQYYDVLNLASYLKKGKNVIAALVHHYGTGTFSYILGRGGFLFDAPGLNLASDESWKSLPGEAWFRDIPRMDIQLEFNEVYDANLAPEGWTDLDFDDSSWQSARVVTGPWQNLTPREIPFMYEHERFPVKVLEAGVCDPVGIELPENNKVPVAIIMSRERRDKTDGKIKEPGKHKFMVNPLSEEDRYSKKGVYVILDFGREIAGFPRIHITTKGQGTIDLGYGELLDADGKVNPHRANVNYADRYRIKPGTHEWETFDRRAFRYMQVDFRGLTKPVTIEISVNFSTYPVTWHGEFECSDERLNEIWRIGAYTVQLNMEDAYTDCPWRERTQWWGDARIEALSNYYAFGDTHLVRQGIRQIGQSQRADGAMIPFWPGSYDTVIPAFCLYWIMSIWDYYMFTGDDSLIPEVFPKIQKLIGWFEGFKDKHGLLTDVGNWMFIEWTNSELEGTVSALNCLYVEALRNASSLAELAHDDKAAKAYANRAEEVRNAINTHLFDPERGAYPEYWSEAKQAFSPKISQMVNGLIAAYDLSPERKMAVLKHVLDPKNEIVPAGSFFAYYLLLGMLRNGMVHEALDYIRTNWGRMLDWGATTFWEQWNTNNSLCHGWASAPTSHLPGFILGVRPTEPGFKRFTVSPNPGDLVWAKGVIPTPHGSIEIEWSKEELTIVVPEGTIADVSLPGKTLTLKPGKHSLATKAH